MIDFLHLAEVQSALAPLVVALAAGWLAHKTGKLPIGIGVVAGFMAAALLINGFDFMTLTAARKVILAGLLAGIVGALVDARHTRGALQLYLGLGIVAAIWVFGLLLTRKSGGEIATMGAAIAAYVAWMLFATHRLQEDGRRAGAATVALGIGTGAASVIGSSALFGQLAFAISAAGGGVLLALLLTKRNDAGTVITFPVGLLAALIGCAAVAFAELAWIVLVILGLIPVVARYTPVLEHWPRWFQIGFLILASSAVAGVALAYAWWTSDVDPYLSFHSMEVGYA
jgi:hypothetical protein